MEIYRFPLAGIAAEIARNNPTVKIVLISPSDEKWYGWDMARTGKMNEKREHLLNTAKDRNALYQDAFGLVLRENPFLRDWKCQTLKASDAVKSVLFSNIKLCQPSDVKKETTQ